MSVTELADSMEISTTTDGVYLYTHSRAGLCKIGTGKGGSTPGMVYANRKGFRSYENASLACINGKLYFRSLGISPSALLVLDPEYLAEIGDVLPDGTGSYKTANNAHIDFGVGEKRRVVVVKEVEETKEVDESESGEKKDSRNQRKSHLL